MLRRLTLRDFVIVTELEVEFDPGFSVLTGETGAGKSILIDALQLALGSRGDSGLLREGSARTEVSAEFDAVPERLKPWLDAAGFDASANFDMQSLTSLQHGDQVRVRRSTHRVRFVHPRGWSYFTTLRRKLRWYEGVV